MKKTTTTILAMASFMSCASAQDAPETKKKERPVKKVAYTVDDLKANDADKDGKLNEAEYKTFVDAFMKARTEKYDADQDGELSADERKSAVEEKKAEVLKIYDTDKDGKISRDERDAMELKLYDYNGDGAIDDAEKAIFKKVRKDKKEKKPKKEKK